MIICGGQLQLSELPFFCFLTRHFASFFGFLHFFLLTLPPTIIKQYVKYPPSDPEKVREEVKARIEREKKQKEQQKAYLEQMRILQESADRSRRNAAALEEDNNNNNSAGIWRWLGFRGKKTD